MTSTYLSFRLYTQDLPRSLSTTASRADVSRDTQYYQDNIGKITSVDQFLKDRRLFSIAMKAHGMDDMTFATAFMRKVLESDLSDPKSFANKLADTRYVEFAKEFNFTTTGDVESNLTYAQDNSQLDDTTELYSEHRAKQGVAAATEAQYYQAKIPTLTSVDDLIADPRLFAFALTAAGMDPTIASKSVIRNVLTSDLSDPGSVANQIGDSRYQDLAAAFSFDADGNVAIRIGGANGGATRCDRLSELHKIRQWGHSGGRRLQYELLRQFHRCRELGRRPARQRQAARLRAHRLRHRSQHGVEADASAGAHQRSCRSEQLRQHAHRHPLSDAGGRLQFRNRWIGDGSCGSQSADQLDATKNQYLANYDDAAQSAESSATSLYSSRVNTLSSVDDLLQDKTLYSYALEAFGLDPSEESKSKIRQILVSDVSDPASFVNAQRDPRYRQLAAAFNFGPDGKALQPRKAQTNDDELATIRLYGTRVGTSDAETAAAKQEGTYYHNTMVAVRSVDDLLADKRLVAYVSKAFGLDGASASKDTLRKALTSDPLDRNSFVNNKGQDPRLRDLAAAFNFAADGQTKKVPAQPAQTQEQRHGDHGLLCAPDHGKRRRRSERGCAPRAVLPAQGVERDFSVGYPGGQGAVRGRADGPRPARLDGAGQHRRAGGHDREEARRGRPSGSQESRPAPRPLRRHV